MHLISIFQKEFQDWEVKGCVQQGKKTKHINAFVLFDPTKSEKSPCSTYSSCLPTGNHQFNPLIKAKAVRLFSEPVLSFTAQLISLVQNQRREGSNRKAICPQQYSYTTGVNLTTTDVFLPDFLLQTSFAYFISTACMQYSEQVEVLKFCT